MSSAGGGAFMITKPANGMSMVFDSFCQTPFSKLAAGEMDFFPITVDFGTATEDFYVGMGAVATPGAIAGIFKLHETYCTIPIRELAEPAIDLAKNGSLVDPFQQYDFELLEPILSLDKENPLWLDGKLPVQGDLVKMPDMADFMDYLVREGEDEFYRGEIAKEIVKLSEGRGGNLQRQDLEQYKVHVRKPLAYHWGESKVETNPLPGLGGAMIVAGLHRLLEMGMDHLLEGLVYLDNLDRRPEVLAAVVRSIAGAEGALPGTTKKGGTTHFSIVDEHGNGIGVSSSNGEGCGTFIPGTNIQLNNMLGELALLPGGLHSWRENERLGSMMAPTILSEKQGTYSVLGSGGAGRIPGAILQVIRRLIMNEGDLKFAVEQSRAHVHNGLANLEPDDWPARMPDGITDVLNWDERSMFFGGVHAVQYSPSRLSAAADKRRYGVTEEVQ